MLQTSKSHIKLIECPRDAMQGLHDFIPTAKKAAYINQLLQVGFDTIDFGSFVSPKAIPQLRDSAEVLDLLDLNNTKTKLLAIVANTRGAEEACKYGQIKYLGFPFSISPTFQYRNTNASIEDSLTRVKEIHELCFKNNKEAVIYISMAFGNPYGDAWSEDLAGEYMQQLFSLGIRIFALSDTIGSSTPALISSMFKTLIPAFPEAEIGAHLHSTPETRLEKITAAYQSGCRRIDSAINGIGGCPMAADQLTGNISTESVVDFLTGIGEPTGIHKQAWQQSLIAAAEIFG